MGWTPEEESDLQNLLRPSDALRGPFSPSLPLSLHSSLLRVARCGEGKQLGELLSAEADGASEASAHLTEQREYRQLMRLNKREPRE